MKHLATALDNAKAFALVLVGAATVVAIWMVAGASLSDDQQQDPQAAAIARERQTIATALRENPGREREWLDSSIRAHRRTPSYIFRELYDPERDSASLDVWFAGNPATPREILAQIARRSTNTFVIAALLENPKLDCWLQGQLARNLMKEQNRDADNANVQRLAELIPDCTPAPALASERSVSLP